MTRQPYVQKGVYEFTDRIRSVYQEAFMTRFCGDLKIALHSDLHFEFHGHFPTIAEDVDIIILAGDILCTEDQVQRLLFIEWCKKHDNKKIIWVAGNHEHYGSNLKDSLFKCREIASMTNNVTFLENESCISGDLAIHGCTLWTDFSSKGEAWKVIGMLEAERGISDFRRIGGAFGCLEASEVATFHNNSIAWLKNSLKINSNKRNIVVTHFPPLMECRHPMIPSGVLDTYFNNDLAELVCDTQPTLWLYGHNHWSDDFNLCGTRFISNQRGYPSEHTGYEELNIIKV